MRAHTMTTAVKNETTPETVSVPMSTLELLSEKPAEGEEPPV